MAAGVKIRTRLLRNEDLMDVYNILSCREVIRGTLQLPSRQFGPMANWAKPDENNLSVVAELAEGPQAGRVIGNAGCRRFAGRRAHVAGLGMSVHPEFHGRGVGTELMSFALNMAEQWWSPTRVELEVYPDNEKAVRLYRKMGFEAEGTKRDYAIREGSFTDALVMSRIYGSVHSGALDAALDGQANGTKDETKDGARATFVAVSALIGTAGQTWTKSGSGSEKDIAVRSPLPDDATLMSAFYAHPGVLRNSAWLPWMSPTAESVRADLNATVTKSTQKFVAVGDAGVLGEVHLQQGSHRMARSGIVTLMVIPPQLGVAGRLLDAALDLSDNWFMLHRLELMTYTDEAWLFPVLLERGFVREVVSRRDSLREGVFSDRFAWGRLLRR